MKTRFQSLPQINRSRSKLHLRIINKLIFEKDISSESDAEDTHPQRQKPKVENKAPKFPKVFEQMLGQNSKIVTQRNNRTKMAKYNFYRAGVEVRFCVIALETQRQRGWSRWGWSPKSHWYRRLYTQGLWRDSKDRTQNRGQGGTETRDLWRSWREGRDCRDRWLLFLWILRSRWWK